MSYEIGKTRFVDVRTVTLDTSIPEQHAAYKKLMESVCIGTVRIMHIHHDAPNTHTIEYFVLQPSPTPLIDEWDWTHWIATVVGVGAVVFAWVYIFFCRG